MFTYVIQTVKHLENTATKNCLFLELESGSVGKVLIAQT